MYCGKCGKKIVRFDNRCEKCGYPLKLKGFSGLNGTFGTQSAPKAPAKGQTEKRQTKKQTVKKRKSILPAAAAVLFGGAAAFGLGALGGFLFNLFCS